MLREFLRRLFGPLLSLLTSSWARFRQYFDSRGDKSTRNDDGHRQTSPSANLDGLGLVSPIQLHNDVSIEQPDAEENALGVLRSILDHYNNARDMPITDVNVEPCNTLLQDKGFDFFTEKYSEKWATALHEVCTSGLYICASGGKLFAHLLNGYINQDTVKIIANDLFNNEKRYQDVFMHAPPIHLEHFIKAAMLAEYRTISAEPIYESMRGYIGGMLYATKFYPPILPEILTTLDSFGLKRVLSYDAEDLIDKLEHRIKNHRYEGDELTSDNTKEISRKILALSGERRQKAAEAGAPQSNMDGLDSAICTTTKSNEPNNKH